MINYDARSGVFLLKLARSFYAIRVLPNRQVINLGHGCLHSDYPESSDWAQLESYGDNSFVWETQGRADELPTCGDISYHDVALRVIFQNDTDCIRDARLRYVNHLIDNSSTTPSLVIEMRDEVFPFSALLHYRLHSEYDVIERWLELVNRGEEDIVVEQLGSGALAFPSATYEVWRPSGTWAREFQTIRHELPPGRTLMGSRGLNTGHSSNPFFLLNRRGAATGETGEVFFAALAHSSHWQISWEVDSSAALRVVAGIHPEDFRLLLQPGKRQSTPTLIHGWSNEGRGGASRRLHSYAREIVLPRNGPSLPLRPVLYNSWEALGFNVSEENQLMLARQAAALGVELFCVDDGWFGSRRDDRAGLGDWFPRVDAFPRGLHPLISEVRRLGMQFGLWVEPEMVNPDSDLYREHPEWVLHFPKRPRTEVRSQLILDLVRPEVSAYIAEMLDRLLRENAIDFLKWDMNRYVTEPGSLAGQELGYRYAQSLYAILDRLRRRHPSVTIESCSGGGGRIDFGIMHRTDQFWPSDNTDAVDRITIQDGYSLVYPAQTMECWVTDEINSLTKRTVPLDFRFHCAMRGALGIGSPLNRLSQEEQARYKEFIAFYKRLRPIIQQGDLYRLESFADSGWSAWQYVAADKTHVVVSLLVYDRQLGEKIPPLRLRELAADAYSIETVDHSDGVRWSRWQLAHLGLPIASVGQPTSHLWGRTWLLSPRQS